jgi:RNA polymerase sigma factor (sigma-70 family)
MQGHLSEEIISGCKRGDRLCQQKLYEFFYRKMMGVSLRYSYSREEAKDLLHDSFIKIFQNIQKFDNKGSLEGWVRRTVVNTVIDHFRKNRSVFIRSDEALENIEDTEEGPENEIAQFSTEDVMKMIQNLSPAYRTVFNMYVFEEYTHYEIAEKLGISVGASKSNLAKARLNLRKQLNALIEVGNEQKK